MSRTVVTSGLDFSITLTDSSDDALSALRNALDRALDAIGEEAVGYAKDTLTAAGRVKTDLLRGSIDTDHDENTVVIGTNVPYAIWHEVGTGIYASDGGGRQTPWRFQASDGRWYTTRGVKPLHYLRNAVADHIPRYKQILQESLENA